MGGDIPPAPGSGVAPKKNGPVSATQLSGGQALFRCDPELTCLESSGGPVWLDRYTTTSRTCTLRLPRSSHHTRPQYKSWGVANNYGGAQRAGGGLPTKCQPLRPVDDGQFTLMKMLELVENQFAGQTSKKRLFAWP